MAVHLPLVPSRFFRELHDNDIFRIVFGPGHHLSIYLMFIHFPDSQLALCVGIAHHAEPFAGQAYISPLGPCRRSGSSLPLLLGLLPPLSHTPCAARWW